MNAINDFLDESIVLPPGDWASKNLLSVQEIQEMRQKKKKMKEGKENLEKEKEDISDEKMDAEKGMYIYRDRGTGVAGVALATPRFLNLLYNFF